VIPPHEIWREGGKKGGKEALQSSYTEELAFFVLRPWMENYGLGKEGFLLTPLPKVGGKKGGKEGAGEGWCFWNTKHPKADIVRRVVLKEEGGREGTMEQALGLPFLPASKEERVEVSYNALDIRPYLHPDYPSLPTCCVPLLSYSSHPSTATATGTHFRKVADVCASLLHVKLSLDIGACQRFPIEPLTSLLLAAFPAAKNDPMFLYHIFKEGGKEGGGQGEVVVWGWLKDKLPLVVAEARWRKGEGGGEGGREVEKKSRKFVL